MSKQNRKNRSEIMKSAWFAFKRAQGYARRFKTECKSFGHYLKLSWANFKADEADTNKVIDAFELDFAMM